VPIRAAGQVIAILAVMKGGRAYVH